MTFVIYTSLNKLAVTAASYLYTILTSLISTVVRKLLFTGDFCLFQIGIERVIEIARCSGSLIFELTLLFGFNCILTPILFYIRILIYFQ